MKPLLIWGLFLLFINSFSLSCKAQTIISGIVSGNDAYTDIPDTVIQSSDPAAVYNSGSWGYTYTHSLDIDLNNDGFNDFKISAIYNLTPGQGGNGARLRRGFIESLQSNAFIASHIDTISDIAGNDVILSVPDIFSLGDTISSNSSYSNQNGFFWSLREAGVATHTHDTWNIGEKYIGVILTSSQDTSYGWIRVEVIPTGVERQLVVKDYALNSIPLYIAQPQSNLDFKIYPNPTSNNILIEDIPTSFELKQLEIYDISGSILLTKDYFKESFEPISISLNDLSNGIYFLKLTAKNGSILSKRIIKKDH